MRTYNIYQCPKCKGFEFRPIPAKKWLCKAGKREEEILIDPKRDTSLTNPPPDCPDFILKERR